jgi:hypothetical protein
LRRRSGGRSVAGLPGPCGPLSLRGAPDPALACGSDGAKSFGPWRARFERLRLRRLPSSSARDFKCKSCPLGWSAPTESGRLRAKVGAASHNALVQHVEQADSPGSSFRSETRHQARISLEITIRWISLVPSPMVQILASLHIFSGGYSLIYPYPP